MSEQWHQPFYPAPGAPRRILCPASRKTHAMGWFRHRCPYCKARLTEGARP